ncbi:hypothetical protein GCM10009839_09880 [Catenulispora yoronensis]|uniref:DUF222 domain-containing protein n=1 Tax=Catenulispora yoronensis TaxID=450799 RepID=A0ABP5F4Q0_9ACTN
MSSSEQAPPSRAEISPELLEAIVAKLLPGIVAEQLAALGIGSPTSVASAASAPAPLADAVLSLDSVPPVRTRVAAEVIAAYEAELAAVVFDPEAPSATPEARELHWTAKRALDHARRALAEAEHDDGRAVAKEIADGREALDDLRESGVGTDLTIEPTTAPGTALGPEPAAYRWIGRDDQTIALDRPATHRTTFIAVTILDTWAPTVKVHLLESGSRRLKHVAKTTADRATANLIPLPPNVTHVRVDANWRARWELRIVDLSDISPLATTASGPRGGFVHCTAVGARAILQTVNELEFHQIAVCDCTELCRNASHQQPVRLRWYAEGTRMQITLPEEPCVLWAKTSAGWSIDVLP